MRHCLECDTTKEEYEFYKHRRKKDGLQFSCKSCQAKRDRQEYYRVRWRDRDIKRVLENQRDLRLKVIKGYGGKCVCCSEDNEGFLTLDHTNNNGREERKIRAFMGHIGVY